MKQRLGPPGNTMIIKLKPILNRLKMKYSKLMLSALILLITGCAHVDKQNTSEQESPVQVEDNEILSSLYKKDLEIRELDAQTDTVNLEDYDKVHRDKVFELLSQGLVITPKDKFKASWILQHTNVIRCEGELKSISPENFLLAYHLMESAIRDTAKYHQKIPVKMAALNYDRYLLFTKGYQKYGTQRVFDDEGNEFLAPIDTTLATDEDRKRYEVETYKELTEKYTLKPLVKE